MRSALACLALAAFGSVSCAPSEPRFPLKEPIWRDTDLESVSIACHPEPIHGDPGHVACTPRPYWSSQIWDGLDNTTFRPISEGLGVYETGEATNVNSMDEVPDSSWFTNRIGSHAMTPDEIALGACDLSLVLHPDTAADGTWIIDHGKTEGITPGFRVEIGGKEYLFKQDDPDQPELASAAQTIGLAIYHAAGFNTPCEQVAIFKPSLLKLLPNLRYKWGNALAVEKAFDQNALDGIVKKSPKSGDRIRMQASAWIMGHSIGPFRYTDTREDDPNDVVAHQNRRELRGSRLIAAWIDHVDAREGNSLDTWIADRPDAHDSSPGHVVHYLLDTSEALGPKWAQGDMLWRRAGYGYLLFDWAGYASDLLALGIRVHVWDYVEKTPGHEIFLYFNAEDFVPDEWRPAYENAAFTRMTECDAAWMARILARFTPEIIEALARRGQFTNAKNTEYVTDVLERRLQRILERYLTGLSPVTDVRIADGRLLCALDLAEWRGLRKADAFRYAAWSSRSGPLAVERSKLGRICVSLPHVAPDGNVADDSPARYVIVRVADGVAQGPLIAHLYDLGPSRGYRLVGLQRPPR
ncbi:MAG TPA: hypothetical protein VEK07_17600 [Polyangiaceae bacterium]|nr:hypothetical protein [Polyangiaceae bacterium]